ncbi:hypothetical protein DH2020_001368 [Rehmannia glutinosa]|uniref:Poly [ADP-ribose] polymerase n=1 Tax=Rehmannia glutinosa TaxID=99300 RepID=A0ABR0XZP8_REHGL
MANPPKPWKVEYAKSSRSSCKTCKNSIEKENLRLGKMVQATQFDGFMPNCRWEDQQKIRKYVDDSAASSNSSASPVVECGVEVSQTSRATCRGCNQKILKGEIRISTKPEGQGARSLTWNHAKVLHGNIINPQLEKFSGWDSLSADERATLLSLAQKWRRENPCKNQYLKVMPRGKELESDTKSKIAKASGNASSNKTSSSSNTKNLEDEQSKASVLENQLEMQTKALWALKDDLKKYVTTSELREMLEANEQDTRGSELDLRERCVDGMFFGALAKCPMCSGWLRYSSGMYRCCGYLSEWTKCSYSTAEPQRIKGKWKIPEETSNEYLLKWFKSQKVKKAERVLPPNSPCGPSGSQSADKLSQSSKLENIGDLKVAFAGVPNESMVYTNCLVVTSMLDDVAAEVKKARRMKLPIVREDYLVDCIKRQKKLPFDLYRVETKEKTHGVATVKVKGQSAVHESSGLQDSGHILEDGKSIYNTTLNMSDLSTGVNRSLLMELTALDYGVKDLSKKKQLNFTSSQLAPQLVELMKMLFNVETYRAAMMEFEINLSEMPLGKLSRSNIQKGFEALTQIQNLLSNTAHAPAVKESLIIDASNRFFTVIPSIHPHVIKDEDDFKSKVKMLEALQDIEIASRIVGFDGDSNDSVDEKYQKLRCHISPLSHDSEDFQLIKKYLHNTHAPTHTEWALELEEVFCLDREGEIDKYAPYRAKLKNRMLLWHVWEGVYFADLVSKSAQYCFTDRKNPVGLMLLSEVALGEVYELTKSQYMDKPPRGKHSTKGLGKKVPLESEYVTWRDEVVVPCGKPVASQVKNSELMYNEFIVYNTAQVSENAVSFEGEVPSQEVRPPKIEHILEWYSNVKNETCRFGWCVLSSC